MQKIDVAEHYTIAMYLAELAGARAPGEYVLQDRTTNKQAVLHLGKART